MPKVLTGSQRREVHRCLMKCYNLEMVDLDVSTWLPQPIESYQRMLAAELRTFCPRIMRVTFWISSNQFCWYFREDEWTVSRMNGRPQAQEMIWRNLPWRFG